MSKWQMENKLQELKSKLHGVPSGTARDKLMHQKRKLAKAIAEGRSYTPDNARFARNTADVDCSVRDPRVKLHVIERRLDHELQPGERRRLSRKAKRLQALKPDKEAAADKMLDSILEGPCGK